MTRFLGLAEQGRTTPFFCEAWRTSNAGKQTIAIYKQEFLVKAIGSPEPMCREVFGNLIARVFGLRTPEPAVVYVPEDVLGPALGNLRIAGRWCSASSGLAAACRRVNISSSVPVLDALKFRHPKDALQLFIYDMLAQNGDRTPANPNCAETADGLVVYDFEQCFSLDGDKMAEGSAWLPCQRGLAGFHFCRPFLAGTKPRKVELTRAVLRLTEERLSKMIKAMPNEWKPEGERIKDHILLIRENLDEFAEDILSALG